MHMFVTVYSLVSCVVINRCGSARTSTAIRYESIWKRKLSPPLHGEVDTACCPLPSHTHTHEHPIPNFVWAKHSSTSIDTRSTKSMDPLLKMPRNRAIIDPPYFSLGNGILEWHKKVGKWVNQLKTAHESRNAGSFDTMYEIDCQKLYTRGLPSEQQSIADESQSKKLIYCLQATDLVKAALDVGIVVAVDPPIAKDTMLIFFNRVTKCRRAKSEYISVFLSRFHGLVATHSDYKNVPLSSWSGPILAVGLLKNASFGESALTLWKLQLISLAESRIKQYTFDILSTRTKQKQLT